MTNINISTCTNDFPREKNKNNQGVDFNRLRREMVYERLRKRGIIDSAPLKALAKIPRELFVPDEEKIHAYDDFPISVGFGQNIISLLMAALTVQVLEINKDDKLLEIGTGSGYQAAVLASMGAKVFSVERIGVLTKIARDNLRVLGYANARVKTGDGTLGWQSHAPYDKILSAAAAYKVPPLLFSQLKAGGKMVIPLGGSVHQTLTLINKTKSGGYKEKPICQCSFTPLVGKHGYKS